MSGHFQALLKKSGPCHVPSFPQIFNDECLLRKMAYSLEKTETIKQEVALFFPFPPR